MIACLFPGQGAYYPGVLKQARSTYLCVERVVAVVEAVTVRRYGRSMIETIWDERSTLALLLEKDPAVLQLAIFTSSVAAHEILVEEGIVPDVMIGHSFGEIAALVCAGAYTIEHGAEIVCDRIDTLAAFAPNDGCMAAISAPADDVLRMIDEWGATRGTDPAARLPIVAVENHDRQSVVAGSESIVTAFAEFCSARKISVTRLKSPYAFHHPDLAPVVGRFATRVSAYPTAQLQTPAYSPILHRYYRDGDDFADCLARHLVMPVGFRAAIRFLHDERVSDYIECGALDALSKIVARVLHPQARSTLPTLLHPTGELDNLRRAVSASKEDSMLTAPEPIETTVEFEAFWRERSPFMMQQIKSEFERFLARQQACASPARARAAEPAQDVAQVVAPTVQKVPAHQSSLSSRAQLFKELVDIYAQAMEYPPEVFNEAVELEAELGIDSVKQTEIVGRISSLYGLPPLPPNFRMGDYKTMGQITDFVFANLRKASTAA